MDGIVSGGWRAKKGMQKHDAKNWRGADFPLSVMSRY